MLTAIEFCVLTRLVLWAANDDVPDTLPDDLMPDQMLSIFNKLAPVMDRLNIVYDSVALMPTTSRKERLDDFPDWLNLPFGEVENG